MWPGPAWSGMWLLQSLAGILEICGEASLFSKFSLPLNCGHKVIKNSSIVVRQPGDQTSLLLSTVNPGSHSNSFEPQLPWLIPSDLLVQIRGRSDLWI